MPMRPSSFERLYFMYTAKELIFILAEDDGAFYQ